MRMRDEENYENGEKYFMSIHMYSDGERGRGCLCSDSRYT
jgi:hypothetical protein